MASRTPYSIMTRAEQLLARRVVWAYLRGYWTAAKSVPSKALFFDWWNKENPELPILAGEFHWWRDEFIDSLYYEQQHERLTDEWSHKHDSRRVG